MKMEHYSGNSQQSFIFHYNSPVTINARRRLMGEEFAAQMRAFAIANGAAGGDVGSDGAMLGAQRRLHDDAPAAPAPLQLPKGINGPALVDLVSFWFYVACMVAIHGWFFQKTFHIFRWRAEIDPISYNVVDSWTESDNSRIEVTGTAQGYSAVVHKPRQNRFSQQFSSGHFHRELKAYRKAAPAAQAAQAVVRVRPSD